MALSIVDRIIGNAPYMCEGDFTDCIRFAKQLGYTGVELNVADPASLNLAGLHAVIQETGMKITAFGTGRAYVNEGLSLTDALPERRAAAAARLRTFLDIAHEFGSLVILGCIRGNLSRASDETQTLEQLAAAIRELEAYAPGEDTVIVLEPINRYENNFLCNVADTAAFIHKAGLRRTKILMDTFHMNIEDPDLVQAIRLYGGDAAYIHIADSNRRYPGCGHTDFPAIFAALAQKGYDGPFCAECCAGGSPEEDCAAWLHSVQELINSSSKTYGSDQ